jgi:hypothetical protein
MDGVWSGGNDSESKKNSCYLGEPAAALSVGEMWLNLIIRAGSCGVRVQVTAEVAIVRI